ncbi:MAG: transglutaminase TgpA family protein [Actinomycetota bacterium]
MDVARQATGETDRRLLVGALFVLAVVTGASFGRVFVGTSPAVRLAAAGVLATGVAVLLARRHLGLSLLLSGAALILALGILVYPRTTWGGLPTDDTLRALLRALERVGEQASAEVAPAPPFASLMAASIIAVWASATAAHALAIRSRSSMLPLLPSAALLAFAGVVTGDGPRPGYVVVFLAAAFAVLFGAAVLRVHSWGPFLHRPRRSRGAGEGARWARWLGLAAAAVALVVPGALPGFEADPVVRLDRPGAGVSISPIVDIRPSLLRRPPADLFTVQADQGAYWRLVTLDRFDGRVWTSSDLTARNGEEIRPPLDLLIGPRPPDGVRLEQTIEIGELANPWLPAAYRPVAVSIEGITARWEPETGILATDDEPGREFRYQVTSIVPVPPPSRLDQLDPRDAAAEDRYTALPPDTPGRIFEIAGELTAAAETPFRKMLAVQEYLRTFTYDERAPAGHGLPDLLYFLEQSQTGYCEQFAGTMAVLARTLGYPARVAVGFLPGDPDRSQRYRITTEDVHAWPEVLFPDYGWLAFEPTPTRDNPTAGYLTQVPAGLRPDANLPGIDGSSDPFGPGPGASEREAFAGVPTIAAPSRPQVSPRPDRGFPLREVLLTLLAAGTAAALLIPPVKTVARRAALARARTPRRRALAAYRLLEAGAADVGLGRRPGETPLEYRSRLLDEAAPSDGHLDRLTAIVGRAMYSAGGVGTDEASEAVAAARLALRDIRRHSGPFRVAAGALRPPGRTFSAR